MDVVLSDAARGLLLREALVCGRLDWLRATGQEVSAKWILKTDFSFGKIRGK